MKLKDLLGAIGSTEESSFSEICQGLGDKCPENREEWGQFFRWIKEAEEEDLIVVSKTNGKIDSAILTDLGKAELNKEKR